LVDSPSHGGFTLCVREKGMRSAAVPSAGRNEARPKDLAQGWT